MPTYTKATVRTYQDTLDSVSPEFLDATQTKLQEMISAEKTDGNMDFIDMHTIKRTWLDQAAVDEWLAFIVPLEAQHSITVTNTVISDI